RGVGRGVLLLDRVLEGHRGLVPAAGAHVIEADLVALDRELAPGLVDGVAEERELGPAQGLFAEGLEAVDDLLPALGPDQLVEGRGGALGPGALVGPLARLLELL